MSSLTFLGGTGTVTGSKFLLKTHGQKWLVDCGLFQGKKEFRQKNWEDFPVPPNQIDVVFLTHAHIDHSGYLPRIARFGFSGRVVCTHGTRELCGIMLRDSAHLQEEDAEWANKKGYSKHKPALPLYTTEDAEKALSLFDSVNYGQGRVMEDTPVRVKFKDAGHILGSSFVEFKTESGEISRKILFSGDIGRPAQPILKDPTQIFDVDILVLESTYGDRLHKDTEPVENLKRVINETVERGGVLVIPAFAVGRTQALLYLLRELEEEGDIPSLPVYMDSPMAINTSEVFRKHIAEFDLVARVESLEGKKIFHPKQLHICRSREESMRINEVAGGAIIISASGMASGGRILHHLEQRLPDSKNTVLIIGYQAIGTRGRALQEGNSTVRIHGKDVPVKARVASIDGFSAHADYNEILAWLMGFNKAPEAVYIVHGDEEASQSMAEKIKDRFGWNVVVPTLGDRFDIDF